MSTTRTTKALRRFDSIYTTGETALLFDVLPETVVFWIRVGKMSGRKVGAQWLIPVEEINRMLRERAS